MDWIRSRRTALLALLFVCVAVAGFAQEAIPAPDPIDWLQEGVNAVTLLAPAAARILVWVLLLGLSRVPVWLLPIVGVTLGMGYDAIDGLLFTNPILAVVKTFIVQFAIREVLDKYFLAPLGMKGKISQLTPDGKAYVKAVKA